MRVPVTYRLREIRTVGSFLTLQDNAVISRFDYDWGRNPGWSLYPRVQNTTSKMVKFKMVRSVRKSRGYSVLGSQESNFGRIHA